MDPEQRDLPEIVGSYDKLKLEQYRIDQGYNHEYCLIYDIKVLDE